MTFENSLWTPEFLKDSGYAAWKEKHHSNTCSTSVPELQFFWQVSTGQNFVLLLNKTKTMLQLREMILHWLWRDYQLIMRWVGAACEKSTLREKKWWSSSPCGCLTTRTYTRKNVCGLRIGMVVPVYFSFCYV